MRKAIASVLVVVMCVFMFAGCGAKTLEQKISKDDIKSMVDEMKDSSLFKTYYKDLDMKIDGNHITYEYWYNVSLDEDEIAAQKEALEASGLEDQIEEMKDQIEKDTKIRPSMISYSYYTADDVLIVTIEK